MDPVTDIRRSRRTLSGPHRTVVGAAAAALLAAGLVACGGGRPDSAADSPSTTRAVATTTVTTSTIPSTSVAAGGSPGGFAATGPVSTPMRVGPAAGHELTGIDRDAGVSVRLRDGSTLWLFGDTAHADDDGNLTYFHIGTAAWASAGSPTETRDVAVSGEPVTFATPEVGFPPCPASAPVAGMWPSSAVVQPMGDVDRVVVWLENICLGSSIRGAARGMAVAEWIYDPNRSPDMPITARILNQTLFPQRSFGVASVLDGDGSAIVYLCRAPEQGGQPDQYGPCLAARVDLDAVADPTAYQVWDGQTWSTDPTRAVPMSMPGIGPDAAPAGSFSVARDPGLGRFVMVYSPWPGYSDALTVRTADAATGPWSVPTTVALPDCRDVVGTVTYWCYAAAAQPIFSEPGRLGIGYYDRRVSSAPVRGSYLVTSIPFAAG